VNIRSVDEAVVIGAALSLSSSAFVLQVFVCIISSPCLHERHDADCWVWAPNYVKAPYTWSDPFDSLRISERASKSVECESIE